MHAWGLGHNVRMGRCSCTARMLTRHAHAIYPRPLVRTPTIRSAVGGGGEPMPVLVPLNQGAPLLTYFFV